MVHWTLSFFTTVPSILYTPDYSSLPQEVIDQWKKIQVPYEDLSEEHKMFIQKTFVSRFVHILDLYNAHKEYAKNLGLEEDKSNE